MNVIIQNFAVPIIALFLVAQIVVGIVRQRRRTKQELAQIRAFGDSADAAAISALDAFEHHANAAVRAAASESLARVHQKLVTSGRSNVTVLLALLDDSRHAVRYAAVKALQDTKQVKSAAPLAALLNNSKEDIRLAATEALANLGLSAKSALLPLLTDKDELLCQRAAKLLLRIGVPESDPIFSGYKGWLAEQRRRQEEERRHPPSNRNSFSDLGPVVGQCSVCGRQVYSNSPLASQKLMMSGEVAKLQSLATSCPKCAEVYCVECAHRSNRQCSKCGVDVVGLR